MFSPDGKFVTATSVFIGIPLRLWDPATGRVVRWLKELDPVKNIQSIAFSPDGAMIAAADRTGTVRLGLTAHGWKIGELIGPKTPRPSLDLWQV